ncbi:MAG: citrate transporter [Clostridia bacterium]|nr:citrate transporter [Clostridia bacterium]
MKTILTYLKHEVVLTVALVAALASFLLVPPGAHTLEGIDTTTLLMLFSLMTIVAGFRHMGAFDKLATAVTLRIRTQRSLAAAMIAACFLLSMVATNDVALITLVPFTMLLMHGAAIRAVTITVVLETIAANLGSMVTPIGNPQNLYLYASGQLDAMDFPSLTWPYALVALILLMTLCVLIPKQPVAAARSAEDKLPARKLELYSLLSVAALLSLAKVLPAWALAAAVLVLTLVLDRPVLRQVDYTLLMTFVCFFVFVASVKAYAPVSAWLEGLMADNPLLTGLLVSQVISNVPACLLLSPFTQNAASLMLGVNIGGLGTLVASLASLISFRLYGAAPQRSNGMFMGLFTVLNVLFLAVMLGLAWLTGAM